MNSITRPLGIVLVLAGVFGVFGSLTIVYLDSVGYWNHPKDFVEALFWDRGSEPTGLGIQGLQMAHYLAGSVVLLALGCFLFSLRGSVTLRPSVVPMPETDSLDELRERITVLGHENQRLREELWRYRAKPATRVAGMLLAVGASTLILSVIYSSSILAFIGLGLAFWGGLLLYARPAEYVKGDILSATTIPSLESAGQEIEILGPEVSAVYLPPEHLEEMKGGKVRITTGMDTPSSDPHYLMPPGLGLANLYEEELGVSFAGTDTDHLQVNLPEVIVKDLEIAEGLEIEAEGNRIRAKIKNSVYKNLCKEIRKTSRSICETLGCPLVSSIALAVARTTGKQVVIERNEASEDGERAEVDFRLL